MLCHGVSDTEFSVVPPFNSHVGAGQEGEGQDVSQDVKP